MARLEGAAASVVAVIAERARHAEAAEEFFEARGQVLKTLEPAVRDRALLGLDLHADDRWDHLLHHRGEIGRAFRLDLDLLGKRQMAVGQDGAAAGEADDAEGEDAREQRVPEAPGSRGCGMILKTPVGP
jgi:hypothetical protein